MSSTTIGITTGAAIGAALGAGLGVASGDFVAVVATGGNNAISQPVVWEVLEIQKVQEAQAMLIAAWAVLVE